MLKLALEIFLHHEYSLLHDTWCDHRIEVKISEERIGRFEFFHSILQFVEQTVIKIDENTRGITYL